MIDSKKILYPSGNNDECYTPAAAVKNEIKRIAVENMGYPYEEINGHIHPIGESESSTDECALLIEAAHILAADLGIILQE